MMAPFERCAGGGVTRSCSWLLSRLSDSGSGAVSVNRASR